MTRKVTWICDGCDEICTTYIYIKELELYGCQTSNSTEPYKLNSVSLRDTVWHKECFKQKLTTVLLPGGEMKFVIPGRLPGLNEIINANRGNRYAGASQKKTETKRCALEIIRQTHERFSKSVHASFVWFEQDLRRDPDNIIAGQKFIFDGLVECGRLPDDTRKWVKSIQHRFADPDKTNPRVEVEITEAPEAQG